MADINEILGRNINSIKELKAAMNELKDSLIGVDASSEEYKATSEKLAAAQEELNKVTRAGKADNDAAADSIRGLEQQYKALYDQYKMLTEEQRNSDFGKNMAASLEEMSTKINDAKKEVGNFTSNIGRYAQGATEAFGKMGVSLGALQTPMKLAAGGAKTLGASLKALIANPVGAVIMAIVVAMKALHAIAERVKKAINDNEESSNRLKVAMATFKPIVDAVSNAFDFLAKIVVKVVEGLAKVAEKIMSVIPGMKKAIESHKELAKATNELTKAQREASVENSKKKAEIERLREEASATDDVIEKKRLLEEAKAMQAEVDAKNVELAREELRIMEEYAAKTANSAEENEKLAAAQKKVNDAIAQGEANMRMYNKQISATETKTKSAGSAAVDYRKKAKELHDQLIEDNKDELTKLTEKYEKEKKLLEKYHLDTTLLTKKYNSEKTVIEIETVQNSQAKIREAYTTGLLQYSKYIEQNKELLKNNAVALADFENQIFEEIKEKYEKITAEQLRINEAWTKDYQKMAEGLTKEDKRKAFNELIEKWNLLTEIFNNGDIKNLSNYSAALEHLNGKIAEYAGKNDTYSKIMTETFKGAKHALEEMGAEGWANTTNKLQEYVDVLREAYGITIDTGEELTRLGEILENNIKEGLGNKAIAEINEKLKENNEKTLEGLIKTISYDSGGYEEYVEEQNRKALELEKATLEESLSNFAGTNEQKLELMQQYYGVLQEMREKDQALADLSYQRTLEMFDNFAEMTDRIAGAYSTYRSSQEALIDSEVKLGTTDEKEARKKKKRLLELQKVQNAFSIATIVADAASGIFSVWKGYASEVGTINPQTAAAASVGGPAVLAALNTKSLISAIAKTTALATTATAQISALHAGRVAAENNFNAEGGGGGSVSVGATPMLIDSTPYTYTRTVQTTEEEDQMNRPIYVTVTDIEDGLGQRAKVTNESSF